MAQPIQFDLSLKGNHSNINIIAKNINGKIYPHYPHVFKTGNAVKIGNSITIYYLRVYSDHVTLHETPENAATDQWKINNLGEVGENIYSLVKTYESIPVLQVENSLVLAELAGLRNFKRFTTGDKVRFETNVLGGGYAYSKLENASVEIIDGGDNLSFAPTVTFSDPNSAGVRATAKALIDSTGKIIKIIMTNPGSGYKATPTVTISNQKFTVKAVEVVGGGSGYITTPVIEFVGGGGSGAQAIPVLDGMSGSWTIQSINLVNPGSGYTSAPTVRVVGGGVDNVSALTLDSAGDNYASAPDVTLVGGGGQGATVTAAITDGKVTSLTLTDAGSGYSTVPAVVFSGGDGSGATTTTYYPGSGGGSSSGGAIVHATATASLAGANTNGTVASLTATIGSSTVSVQGSTRGTLGTLENELVDEIQRNIAYFVRKISDSSISIHRTEADALNNMNPLDFGTDNVFAGLAITKVINDSEFTQTSAPISVSQTTLSHNVLKNTITLPVDNANGFDSGKSVIIDEGDCEEETNIILRATPTYLVLTTPLTYSHEKSKTVRLVLPNE